jgi:hypothetical protein
MTSNRLAIGALLLPLLAACGGETATSLPSGPIVLDQSSDGGTSYTVIGCPNCYDAVAETFTVGAGGLLSRLVVHQVLRDSSSAGTDPLVVEVRRVAGGIPDQAPEALCARVEVPDAEIPRTAMRGALDLDLASFKILVTPGEMLCFVLRSSGSEVGFASSDSDVYPGGQEVKGGGSPTSWDAVARDLGFETYVQTP